jgi:4-aminobutyrate aminotransferase-like enzyme/Ser/Thr protein kinase RdoA (MazF antagonist)
VGGILERFWGMSAELRGLPSERDQNFLVDSGRLHVLKIAGSDEPTPHLELQNAALAWLATHAPVISVPRLVPTADGQAMASIESDRGTQHAVRLLTHVPGVPLATARPHSSNLLRSVGAALGEVTLGLQGFQHPSSSRDFVWNPALVPDVIHANLHAVDLAHQRLIVAHILELWDTLVAPRLPELRRSVTYNDANDHNVLVDESAREPRAVAGFVDFGDMVDSWTVADPAIAVAYAMLDKPNPLAAAAAVVTGYHGVFPLEEAELNVLFPLACARLAVSVCVAARRRRSEPDNAYLVVSERPAWEALERLAAVHPRFARNVLRNACSLPPCPGSPAVHAWLRRRAGQFAPVVDPDPRRVPTTVLDLSVGSTEFPDADRDTGTESFASAIFHTIARRGATIGMGRYDEPRLVYASDAFEGPDTELPESRTIHLGMDLFLEAGAPVSAPLDAIVHAVHDDASPLDYGPTVILRHEPANGPTFYTLYGHLNPNCLQLEPGAPIGGGDTFARIGCFEDNGNWPPHLHFQIITDLLDRDSKFPGVAAPSERAVWLSMSPDPNLILGLEGDTRAPDPGIEMLLEARQERLGRNLSLSYRTPLHIVRGRAQYLYDSLGHRYLDCVNNVAHVGHAHPRVVEAIARQSRVLNTNTRYLHETILRYAERLGAMLPDPLTICYIVNSGSEANDVALRMARAATGADDIIVLKGAYHGHTAALIDASPYKHDGPGGRGAPPHVNAVVMPDDYRGPYRRNDATCGEKYARHVAEAIEDVLAADRQVGAFLSETLLSCGGQIELPPQYLREAYRYTRAAGGICIADEVQVGFGRLGTHFWGFETQGVVPDIVTLGKPIGNGHPLGAVVTTPAIARAFDTGMEYFNTFGGNPVSCAAGLAVLDVIRDERLQEHARIVGTHLQRRLSELRNSHPVVGDVRGRGLFLGVELVREQASREPATAIASYVIDRVKDHGILLSTDGPGRNVIKIKPPLVFTEGDADRLVAVLDRILREDVVRQAVES